MTAPGPSREDRAAVSLRLMPCRYGLMLFHPHDAFIGRSLELYGEFSEGEAELFRSSPAPQIEAVSSGRRSVGGTRVRPRGLGF